MEMIFDSPLSFLPLCVLFSLCVDNVIKEMASTIYITTLLSILDRLPLYVCSG
jgi:branched-subunit amino acid transport protein